MRNRRNRSASDAAPNRMDAAFAQALAGQSFERSNRHQKFDHKARQLCRQVQRALNLSLGEFGDELLNQLYIADVTPVPGSSLLLVHVCIPSALRLADVIAKLEQARPTLRMEVARAITRKRAPELTFLPVASQVQP